MVLPIGAPATRILPRLVLDKEGAEFHPRHQRNLDGKAALSRSDSLTVPEELKPVVYADMGETILGLGRQGLFNQTDTRS